MEKLAANHTITSKEAVKIAAKGFASILGSPSTNLNPNTVKGLTSKFVARSNKQAARHRQIVKIVGEHANAR